MRGPVTATAPAGGAVTDENVAARSGLVRAGRGRDDAWLGESIRGIHCDQGLSHGHHVAWFAVQLGNEAGERHGNLYQRLGRLDLDDALVDGDGVSGPHVPGYDLGLG